MWKSIRLLMQMGMSCRSVEIDRWNLKTWSFIKCNPAYENQMGNIKVWFQYDFNLWHGLTVNIKDRMFFTSTFLNWWVVTQKWATRPFQVGGGVWSLRININNKKRKSKCFSDERLLFSMTFVIAGPVLGWLDWWGNHIFWMGNSFSLN